MSVERTDSGYRLRLALPFAVKDDLDLHRRRDELHVKVGAMKRTIPLPAVLHRCEIGGARLHEGSLEVRFRVPTEAVAP